MIKSIIYNIQELRKPCLPVEKGENIKEIILDLKDTLYSLQLKQHGLALAANQIGYLKQITLIRIPLNKEFTKFKEYYLINPKILDKQGKVIFPETCLSFPGIVVNTLRYKLLIISNTNLKLKPETLVLKDIEAIICEHEIDHLKGRTIFDAKHRSK